MGSCLSGRTSSWALSTLRAREGLTPEWSNFVVGAMGSEDW